MLLSLEALSESGKEPTELTALAKKTDRRTAIARTQVVSSDITRPFKE